MLWSMCKKIGLLGLLTKDYVTSFGFSDDFANIFVLVSLLFFIYFGANLNPCKLLMCNILQYATLLIIQSNFTGKQ